MLDALLLQPSSMEQPPVSAWATLPKEIVETLGLFLDASGWAAARATCLHWSRNITHGITLLEVDLERDAHRQALMMLKISLLLPSRRRPEVLATWSTVADVCSS